MDLVALTPVLRAWIRCYASVLSCLQCHSFFHPSGRGSGASTTRADFEVHWWWAASPLVPEAVVFTQIPRHSGEALHVQGYEVLWSCIGGCYPILVLCGSLDHRWTASFFFFSFFFSFFFLLLHAFALGFFWVFFSSHMAVHIFVE